MKIREMGGGGGGGGEKYPPPPPPPPAVHVPSPKTAERKASALIVHLSFLIVNHASHDFHALAQSVMIQRTDYWVPNSNTGGCVSKGTLFPNDINY